MELNNPPMGIPTCFPCRFFDENSHEQWRPERTYYFLHEQGIYTDRYSHARHVTVTLVGLNGRKKTGKKVFAEIPP